MDEVPSLGDEPITLSPLVPRDDATRESVVTLYRVVFGAPPYDRTPTQIAAFRETLRAQVTRPGFTAFQAIMGTRLVGFAYGYTTKPHHQWHRNVRVALGARADYWLSDCFAFAELAVHPVVHGLGVGRALHDELLAAVSHSKAVLSTLDEPTPGRALYASHGWRVLAEDVRFPVSVDRYVIMGRVLGRR